MPRTLSETTIRTTTTRGCSSFLTTLLLVVSAAASFGIQPCYCAAAETVHRQGRHHAGRRRTEAGLRKNGKPSRGVRGWTTTSYPNGGKSQAQRQEHQRRHLNNNKNNNKNNRTPRPTASPTAAPTTSPTAAPTTTAPTLQPTKTRAPTLQPTSPFPTPLPTLNPTEYDGWRMLRNFYLSLQFAEIDAATSVPAATTRSATTEATARLDTTQLTATVQQYMLDTMLLDDLQDVSLELLDWETDQQLDGAPANLVHYNYAGWALLAAPPTSKEISVEKQLKVLHAEQEAVLLDTARLQTVLRQELVSSDLTVEGVYFYGEDTVWDDDDSVQPVVPKNQKTDSGVDGAVMGSVVAAVLCLLCVGAVVAGRYTCLVLKERQRQQQAAKERARQSRRQAKEFCRQAEQFALQAAEFKQQADQYKRQAEEYKQQATCSSGHLVVAASAQGEASKPFLTAHSTTVAAAGHSPPDQAVLAATMESWDDDDLDATSPAEAHAGDYLDTQEQPQQQQSSNKPSPTATTATAEDSSSLEDDNDDDQAAAGGNTMSSSSSAGSYHDTAEEQPPEPVVVMAAVPIARGAMMAAPAPASTTTLLEQQQQPLESRQMVDLLHAEPVPPENYDQSLQQQQAPASSAVRIQDEKNPPPMNEQEKLDADLEKKSSESFSNTAAAAGGGSAGSTPNFFV